MRTNLAVVAAAWLGSLALAAGPVPAEECFQVVVHGGQEAIDVDVETLSHIFLKRRARWPDGAPAVPVDQELKSPVRQQFSREVLGRSASAVDSYWQHRIFSGRGTPPEELATDQQVLDWVRRMPGAVGYVSCEALPAPEVRQLGIDRPLILALSAEPEQTWLRLGEAPTESLLATVVPQPFSLAQVAAQSPDADVRILLTGTCGSGGQRILLHSRETHGVRVDVEHRVVVDGRPRHRRVRAHELAPGGRRFLGCSNVDGVEHSLSFRKEP